MAEKEKVRMIDLAHVQVPRIDGTFEEMDVSKEIAGLTYNMTQDEIEVVSACLDLFKTGQCKWSEKVKEDLYKTVNNLVRMVDGEAVPVGIVLKRAILNAIG